MALRIGEMLMNEKLITQGQLEEALQAQVIFGGKLGTILLEMGAVGELDLARILSKQLGSPCLHPDQLTNIPEDVINAISPELAEKFMVLPVSLDHRRLTVGMSNPRDLKVIDELAFRTGYVIRPMLAPELRLNFALEQYYKLRRKVRYIAPPKPVQEELERVAKGGSAAAAPIAPPPPPPPPEPYLADLGGEPDLADLGAEPNLTFTPFSRKPAHHEEPLELAEVELAEEVVTDPAPAGPVTLEETTWRLVDVRDRNEVAEALLHYLGSRYARAALFMLVGGQVSGWRSVRHGVPIPGFEDFQLPLSEVSVLRTAAESQSYFIGPIPSSGANLALLTLLGKPAPATALLLPLIMLGRVVGLVYLDDPQVAPAEALVDAQRLAGKALLAFELLILKSKILRL